MEKGKISWERNRSGYLAAIIYELIGSAVLTAAFTLCPQQTPFYRATVYLALYVFAVHVSGAHFNPATSLAVYLTERGDQKRKNNFRYLITVIIC